MKDTQGRDLMESATLNDVKVRILYAHIVEETYEKINQWKQRLMGLGASKVEIYTPDQSEVLSAYNLDSFKESN